MRQAKQCEKVIILNTLEVNISEYSKTTELMDKILNRDNAYSRVIFLNMFTAPSKYKIHLVCDLNKENNGYDYDVPHYYYTMTQIKNGLYPNYADIKCITEIHDYGMEEEVAHYMKSDSVEVDKIIPFHGDYTIHSQRSQDYKSGGWGNNIEPTLYVIGFIVRER